MTQPKTRLHGLQYIGHGVGLRARARSASRMPLHSHDYFELEILLEGVGTMELNSQQYALKRGVVYLLTPADFHEVLLSEPNRLWNISFDGSVLLPHETERLYALKDPVCTVDESTLTRLDLCARLLSEESDPNCQRLLAEYLLRTADLLRETELSQDPIRRALRYIEAYFRDAPSLERVAAHVGWSASYFGTRFREETGETFVDFLNRCKVNCAAMLLKSGKSVAEACFASGFGSLSGFRYVFRQKTGMTPTEFVQSEDRTP